MATSTRGIRDEAWRLLQMPPERGRAAFNDRCVRAALIAEPEIAAMAFDFNARLATELRELADAQGLAHLWATRQVSCGGCG